MRASSLYGYGSGPLDEPTQFMIAPPGNLSDRLSGSAADDRLVTGRTHLYRYMLQEVTLLPWRGERRQMPRVEHLQRDARQLVVDFLGPHVHEVDPRRLVGQRHDEIGMRSHHVAHKVVGRVVQHKRMQTAYLNLLVRKIDMLYGFPVGERIGDAF